MQTGRPTKYKAEYCDLIIEFFSIHPFEIFSTPFGPKRTANTMPTFHDFARTIGVNEDTVVEWATAKDVQGQLKHADFSAAYREAKTLQKWFLIENGLNGVYNSRFAEFTAMNISDMRRVVQPVDDNGNTLKPQTMNVLNLPVDELLGLLTAASANNAHSTRRPAKTSSRP